MIKKMVKDFGFEFKGKRIELEVEECKSVFEKGRGLMFRKNSKPLLFYFSKAKRYSIHSFFCVQFIAIWFDEGEIVDAELVKPWKLSVKPKMKFDRLLEIPINDKNFSLLSDDKRFKKRK